MRRSFIILLLPLLVLSCGRKQDEEQEVPVERSFDSFIFVGMIQNRPGLYKYNADKSSFSEFWHSKDEKVVELSYQNSYNAAFFLTAVKEGKEGIFPFIKDARLYVISDPASKPVFVKEIGSGLQVFSRWESETVFRIVLNSWDTKVSTYINQRTFIFNTFGRILREETKTYDITSDGYPRLPASKPDSLSPSGRYGISVKGGKSDSVYLVQRKNNSEYLISKVNKPVNEIVWSDNRNLIFLSTLDVTPANRSIFADKPNTSSLYIFSVAEKKIIKKWTGAGNKNFITISDFLIFDDGFGRNSSIYIYNFKEDKIVKQIRITGGCGLRGIPKIPKFGS